MVSCPLQLHKCVPGFVSPHSPCHHPPYSGAHDLCVSSGTQKVADELYTTLQKSVRSDGSAVDFLAALSGTLKAVYIAVKEYRPLVHSAFGPAYVVTLIVDVIKDLDNKVRQVVPYPVAWLESH